MSKKEILTLTPLAAKKIKAMIVARGKETLGIRINVKQKGCSGNAYTLEYVDQIAPMDEVIKTYDLSIYIDPKATLFVIGTEMDYQESALESGFKFINPNEKGRCGCGESFYV